MEIRFSDAWAATNAAPEQPVKHTAAAHGFYARLKWADDSACRFTLVEHAQSYQLADWEAHRKVIAALLAIDPGAEVRTAKAIYRGRADFERQTA